MATPMNVLSSYKLTTRGLDVQQDEDSNKSSIEFSRSNRQGYLLPSK